MALIRNLGNLTAINLFADDEGHNGSEYLDEVCEKLKNSTKIHPTCILHAQKVYSEGRRWKGSLSEERCQVHWEPNERITEALSDAFYLSLKVFRFHTCQFGMQEHPSYGLRANCSHYPVFICMTQPNQPKVLCL